MLAGILRTTAFWRSTRRSRIRLVCTTRKGRSRQVGILFNDIADRKRAEAQVQAQFARLNLPQQLTRPIGEHQDIQSIFQVVIRTLEERADFTRTG
jgi:hypothetical protein